MSTGTVPTGEEQVVEAALTLVEDTARLQDASLGALSDTAVEECLRACEKQRRRLDGFERTLLAEVTRRGMASAHHCTGVSTYLRDLLNVSVSEANRRIRAAGWLAPRYSLLGEELPAKYPTLAAAADEAAVSGEHVEVIATMLDRLPDEVPHAAKEHVETILTTEARTAIPAAIAARALQLGQHLDPDGTIDDARKQRDKATVTLSKGLHGMLRLSGLLDPESGAIVKTALDTSPSPLRARTGNATPATPGSAARTRWCRSRGGAWTAPGCPPPAAANPRSSSPPPSRTSARAPVWP